MRIAAFLLVLLLAACSHDRQIYGTGGPPPRDENYHGGPNAMLLKYDANHDGTLTRDELIAGLKADFAAADVHHTGCLDDDQVAAINQARVEADQSAATPLMDWNNDGCVDFTEFAAAPYSLFEQLDRNSDGKVEPKEFDPNAAVKPAAAATAAPAHGRHGRRGDGQPPPDGGTATPPQLPGTPPGQ